MFNLRKILGPFIINSRKAFRAAEELLKKMNFNLGDACHYDPYDVIGKRRESIKDSTYEHEYRLKIEWKSNLDLWPTNTKMEIKVLKTKDKTQKRIIDQIEDVEMEDVPTSKKEKTQ